MLVKAVLLKGHDTQADNSEVNNNLIFYAFIMFIYDIEDFLLIP